ncbi:MAG: ABC transporter permease [Verrucomicrobiae bacterium]|nr:ABC transporter permease [Verrucomicrobiae bacterium]
MQALIDHGLGVLGAYVVLTREALYWTFIGPFRGARIRFRAIVDQMFEMGVRSVFIAILIMFFIGLVLTMESSRELVKIGTVDLLSSIVCASILRQMGPLIVGCIVIARCGSAIAAELGSMKVSEEIEALRTMGVNPVRFLIGPRMLAMLLMLPVLTIFGNLVGCAAGMGYAWYSLGIDPGLFIRSALPHLSVFDLFAGIIKSLIFGFLISTISCYYGFNVEGGAEGVGKATTNSVVQSIIAIIVANCILTAIFVHA